MSAGRSRPSAASTWSRTVCLLVMLVPSRAPKLHGTPVESRRRGSRLSADGTAWPPAVDSAANDSAFFLTLGWSAITLGLSTTLERDVAMGYASSGSGNHMGIVIEVQQGMVSRGADMSWLSQYPHECE